MHKTSGVALCWTILGLLSLLDLHTVSADVRISEPHPHSGFMRATHKAAAFGPRIGEQDTIAAPIISFETHPRGQKYGCTPFGSPWYDLDAEAPAKKPWIALILRGQCAFEQKVRTAMQMGIS